MEGTNKNHQPKPIRVKGTGIFAGEEFSFQPCEPGEPAQLDVKVCKGGKTYTTTSEKRPLRIAHLSCPAESADPYAEYQRQLARLGIKPQRPQDVHNSQRLLSDGGMEVFLNSKEGMMTYQGVIDLAKGVNWQSELVRQLQLIVRTIPTDSIFSSTIIKFKKGGIKK